MTLTARLRLAFGERIPPIDPGPAEKLERLEALVSKWSRAVDLEGFKTLDERDRRYFAEPLAAAQWLPEAGRALDIGSGGGSPALPLAILSPTLEWTLMESNERKALFLDEAIRAVGLENATVSRVRFERSLGPPVSLVTLRGVTVDEPTAEAIAKTVLPGGRWLWFSSEAKLAAGSAWLRGAWRTLAGPTELIPEGAHLLVAERLWSP